MFDPKIKIDKELFERLTKTAEVAGYSSTQEFIIHLLETAAGDICDNDSEELIRKRLQGLGYLE